MAKWEDNMRGAVTPEGIMTTTGGEAVEGGNWADNWRSAWTPEGLKIVGDGGGSNGVASSLEDENMRVWIPYEGAIMIGGPEGAEDSISYTHVMAVTDLEFYSNVGADEGGEWSPSIALFGANGTSNKTVDTIHLQVGGDGVIEITGGLALNQDGGRVNLSSAERTSADYKEYNLRFPRVEDGEFVVATDPPATASSLGIPGQQAYDSDYLYVCVDTDTWKRTELSSW